MNRHFVDLILVILFHFVIKSESIKKTVFPIGGVFNIFSEESSLGVFEAVVDKKNTFSSRTLLSNVSDSFSTALEICDFTSNSRGIIALIDGRPTNGICDAVCMLCNNLNISHLSIAWEPPEMNPDEMFTFSYYPPPDLISKAYATYIKDLAWDKFSIFYEDEKGLIRLQDIINSWPYDMEPITYRQIFPEGDNRETFKQIFKVERISYHIIDCDINNTIYYMKEIMQIENSTQYQSFILTNLDAYTLDFKQLPELKSNVSTMHLMKMEDVRWRDVDFYTDDMKTHKTGLAVDALNHLEKALRHMEELDTSFVNPPSLCIQKTKLEYQPWLSGFDLRDALLNTSTTGFTGDVTFDVEGKRSEFSLFISKLNSSSDFIVYGEWHSKTNIINKTEIKKDSFFVLDTGKTIKVLSKLGEPYFSLNDGNDTDSSPFRGYAIDLIDVIFKHINKEHQKDLKYEFFRVANDNSGNPIPGTKKWNGMIGELMDHNADLAICDFTITSERNSVVDFSIPFMSLGISMLFREPDPVDPDMFSFMNPFDISLWLYLATSYILVSLVLLICARMCQDDWVNPHPCNPNPEKLENIWSLYNCTWLTMGSIMTQGCDILPRAYGSRWVTGMWWFFCLIVTASYTANMSTFLSNDRRDNAIDNVQELAEQHKISYGAMEDGSTYKFFKFSNNSVYQKIWQTMESTRPSVFTKDNTEGRNRVIKGKGKYVFFMESSAIEYNIQRHCQLKMVGPNLDSKEYGIAMPKRSPLKNLIDSAILFLQEKGELDKLKTKWWKEEDITEPCEQNKNADEDDSLKMKSTSGIFLVLAVGAFLGLIVAVIDFLLHSRKICVKEGVTFREAVLSEWRTSLNPRSTRKPAAPTRSAAPSIESSPLRERSQSRAASVLRAASSFINFDEVY